MTKQNSYTLMKVVFIVLLALVLSSCGKAKKLTADDMVTKELQFVSVQTNNSSAGNGWNEGETLVGFYNTGKETICSMYEYQLREYPTLQTKEGKDYEVSIEIGGPYSVYPEHLIPLNDFPPIPPGFKIYSFGQNPTFVYLNYKYAQAATPKQIASSENDIWGAEVGRLKNTIIDINSSEYNGEAMYYGNQPVKRVSQLKGMKIEMQDEALEATFTGKCIENKDTGIKPGEGYYAEITVKNTDKFDGYYPKSNWLIAYYVDGGGDTRLIKPHLPGYGASSIGPGMTETLYVELEGTVVIFEGGCHDDYFIVDYSDC